MGNLKATDIQNPTYQTDTKTQEEYIARCYAYSDMSNEGIILHSDYGDFILNRYSAK